MSLFVTGTDTGVGKTRVSSLLIRALRSEGVDAVGYKPVSSGDRADAVELAEASGGLDIDLVNPVHVKTPVAPFVAGLLENRVVDPAMLVAGYESLAAHHEVVIVEGVGGWEVPITAEYRVADLAADLHLPILIVAANRLGALNHILLTAEAIRQRGLPCAGIVLNQLTDEMDTAMITNKGVIEQLAGLPLLDHIIHGQDFIDPALVDAARK
ncbi:MAG: dethiobiotin synthase [Verrucomicrobiota bacterium]